MIRAATLAVGACAWGVAAWLLWRTTLPPLHLPRLDERVVFGSGLVHRAQRFERLLDWNWVVAQAAVLTAYVVVLRRAQSLASGLHLQPVNAGIVLGLFTLTVVWAVSVPFVLVASWWERRHGISRAGYASVLAAAYGRLLLTSLIALAALAVVLPFARRFGRSWWLPAAFALAAIVFVLELLQPYQLSLGTHPLRSRGLAREVGMLEQRERAGHPVVRVGDVSGSTTEANAFSVGIGPTRRVILWNTLLDGRFPNGEVRFAVAHELAHVARNHVARGVGWFLLFALPVLLVTSLIADVRRAAAVPLALFVVAVGMLALLPFANLVSRRYEAEADWIALNATRDPAAAAGLFGRLAATDLQDPSPPRWVHVLLDDHPTDLQRVELARAWSARNRR